MKKTGFKRNATMGSKLLLFVIALLFALTGCEMPKTDDSINAKITHALGGYARVSFDSFADFDLFRQKLQQEHERIFYFLDEDAFEGRITKYEYLAEDTMTALVAPYEPTEYSIHFEFEEDGELCSGYMSVNLFYVPDVKEMTDELFATRAPGPGGRSLRHWHYSVNVGEKNDAIASIIIEAKDEDFSTDELIGKVVEAMRWAYRDQGSTKAEDVTSN